MALDKDILGLLIYNVRQDFVNRDYNDLISEFGNMDAARLAQAKAEAEAIINHFKANGLIHPGTWEAGPYSVVEIFPGTID